MSSLVVSITSKASAFVAAAALNQQRGLSSPTTLIHLSLVTLVLSSILSGNMLKSKKVELVGALIRLSRF